MSEPVRLHKLLARAGVASLRASERLIAEGRVSVNGEVVRSAGTSATLEDDVRVDGAPVRTRSAYRYVALHKPPRVLSTASDERGRLTVLDLVGIEERLYPVGRLDLDSEGLLLLTNDGELAERVMHPRYGVHKRYRVEVAGFFALEDVRRLREGVELEDGPSKPLDVGVVRTGPRSTTVQVLMGEGRKRQVRRMFDALGFKVLGLVREAIGPIELGDLPSGDWRDLTEGEVRALREAVGLAKRGERA